MLQNNSTNRDTIFRAENLHTVRYIYNYVIT